jgi:hypothetical protein
LATETSRLPGDAWDLLSPFAPKRSWFFDWDMCARIRSGVIDKFLDDSLPSSALISLTENTWVFKEVTKEIADSKKGREILIEIQPVMPSWQKKIVKQSLAKKR